ncbi:hypothetical protein PHY01_52340 [Pseudonocardia hydrocarbonoxydans]|uniref:Uncharacterized protein n=1 Tax=Pseudonocardia hydrocarbonoxydans TaxID=76726 RepID=A0A4Y3WXF0_9PSEU|nr:hypothetical protein PHY01_52340 [Pseudonocardia hydrocarbonoxydans]
MKIIVRKPRSARRSAEILRLIAVALATAIVVVGLGFVGAYAGASAACRVAPVDQSLPVVVVWHGTGNPAERTHDDVHVDGTP